MIHPLPKSTPPSICSSTLAHQRRAVAALSAAGGILLASLPAEAQSSDPFAAPGAATATAQPPSAASAGSAPGPVATVATLPGCEHITRVLCEKQNNTMLALDGGYVAGCVLVAALLRAWFNRRGTGSIAFRFLLPLLLASLGAGILTATDPARGPDLACCLGTAAFRAQVLLQDSSIGRAVLFGALPAVVLFTVVVIVIRAIKK